MSVSSQVVDDDAVLAFELRWFECGGGPEHEIRDRFGLTPTEFFARLLHLLDADPPPDYSPRVVEAMKAVARRRRWLAG